MLEVGAGPGVLTRELAQLARRWWLLRWIATLPVLRETTTDLPNVEIIPRNSLLEVQPDEVFGAEPYKLVANLPDHITSLILRHLLESVDSPRVLVVMVQREVAERLVAVPGEMSLLALSVQFYGMLRIVTYVPADGVFPAAAGRFGGGARGPASRATARRRHHRTVLRADSRGLRREAEATDQQPLARPRRAA